jgi:hypothetical protein
MQALRCGESMPTARNMRRRNVVLSSYFVLPR